MILIDKLCYLSKLRYVNPMEKFAFAMLTLIFCMVSRSIVMGLFVIVLNSWLTVVRGGISAKRYRNLMMVPLVFLAMSTIAIVLNISKTPLDAFAIPIGSFFITGSCAGLLHGLRLAVTALSAVSCLYFLSFNTPMTDILCVLRKLKVPPLMAELMLLIYRYIFILLDAAYYISTSQAARLGHKDFRTSLKSFGAMVQTLFLRAMKRSGSLYDAMEARCYDGEIRVLDENLPLNRFRCIIIAVFELTLFGITVFLRLHG